MKPAPPPEWWERPGGALIVLVVMAGLAGAAVTVAAVDPSGARWPAAGSAAGGLTLALANWRSACRVRDEQAHTAAQAPIRLTPRVLPRGRHR